MLDTGDTVPDVTLQMADGSMAPLASLLGKPLVLFFYPKDDTSGCTREAIDFSQHFAAAGAGIFGISKNSPKDHAKFTAKHQLTVPLATDPDGSVCEAFGTWIEKSLYGRKYMGIDRATFLIDGDGKIAKVWRKVKVPGHVEAVLTAVQALTTA
jgi:peroxiredoxin Q/BCP